MKNMNEFIITKWNTISCSNLSRSRRAVYSYSARVWFDWRESVLTINVIFGKQAYFILKWSICELNKCLDIIFWKLREFLSCRFLKSCQRVPYLFKHDMAPTTVGVPLSPKEKFVHKSWNVTSFTQVVYWQSQWACKPLCSYLRTVTLGSWRTDKFLKWTVSQNNEYAHLMAHEFWYCWIGPYPQYS